MPVETPFTLILNSLTLALSMGFLIIIVWYDVRRRVNQFFAILLIFMQIWNAGFLLGSLAPLFNAPDRFEIITLGMSQAGFIGAGISIYALMSVVIGVQPRRFRVLTFFYLVFGVVGVGFVTLHLLEQNVTPDSTQFQSISAFFFIFFDMLTLYTTWRYWRKLRSIGLITGIVLFVLGQGVSFLNPELGIVSLSVTVSSIGTLIISFIITQRELITPLLERSNQLESMHEVSIAITSRIATDAVLTEIAERAAEWLEADATGIFLKHDNILELVALHQLPIICLHRQLQLGEGVAGQVAATNESMYLENYQRDWDGVEDLPFARATFGSVICVPLVYDNLVIGTLMVIAGQQGTLFDKSDVRLLELLAAQAAVTITHGNFFNAQKILTEQLESANAQLGAVLSSTENPVLAVDRNLNLIFTNKAAETLFHLDTIHSRANIMRALPRIALPTNYREALKTIRRRGAYRYEVEFDGKIYLCHVASLGGGRLDGFVAVLNDVTELKELDRIKSEMVRMTSHDLKNPLQAALANLELLHDDVAAFADPEIELSVNNIEHQLIRMNRIISGILDLERVRLGSNLNEICHPKAIVDEALDELRDMAREQDVQFVLEIDDKVASFVGDTDQFKRAIINLIENAIKFNKPGGMVRISARNRANQVLFMISDDGIGIPEHLTVKIFDRFFRGHQPGAEHITGTGLGLSLVKAVIESHYGYIRVESEPGVGTTFYITVPAMVRKVDTVP